MRPIDRFYEEKEEPIKSCLMALRDILQNFDIEITEEWKFKLPYFYYKGKMFCYIWIDKKTKNPYLGIANGYLINHPSLIAGNRSHVKILPIDMYKDIPIDDIYEILNISKSFRDGV